MWGSLISAAYADVHRCAQVQAEIPCLGVPVIPTLLIPLLPQANLPPRVGVKTNSSKVDWPAQRRLLLIFLVLRIDMMRRSSSFLTDAL